MPLKNITLVILISVCLSCKEDKKPFTSWEMYRGDDASTAYSALEQINKTNVTKLKPAWTYHTGDAREGNRSTIQCNPIVNNGMMYVTSPLLKLVALNPENGKEIWRFDPFKNEDATGVNRGVTYWSDNKNEDRRIFFSAGSYLYALNANDGKPINNFGMNGRIDLRKGLGRDPEKLAVAATTPGIIYKDLIIQGTALGEGYDAAPGFIRAYNVYTGKISWTFHTIPQPGEYGYDTWEKDSYKEVGGTNAWAGMSIDQKREIVYIPLGSPAFDFYGGNRKGENIFGNCLVAVNANTGKRIWHYQFVHHDLWDYDLPAPPNLITVQHEGKQVDAVAQITKMGMVFLLDRENGRPLFDIEEKPIPKSDLLGEESWTTQPFPVKPKPFVRQQFTEDEITNLSPESNAFVKDKLQHARMGTIYTPPSIEGTVQLPGTRGGGEWGGASYDPHTNILYVNANETAMLVKMKQIDVSETDELLSSKGEKLFTLNNCTMCHGADRRGTTVFPSLINISKRLTEDKVNHIIKAGRGQMPAFPNLSENDLQALIAFLFGKDEAKNITSVKSDITDKKFRYVHDGWNPLVDQFGYPGIKPPWGTLNAIDLNKGEILWQVTLGEYPELLARGLPPTGTLNLGGSIVTAGGLLFIGATRDEKFRAFNKATGEILWEYKLPAGGFATPSTFMIENKQYIVIACGGGGKVGSPSGDAYVAFTLQE